MLMWSVFLSLWFVVVKSAFSRPCFAERYAILHDLQAKVKSARDKPLWLWEKLVLIKECQNCTFYGYDCKPNARMVATTGTTETKHRTPYMRKVYNEGYPKNE